MPDMTAVWPTDQAPGSVSSEARWRKMARLYAPSGIDTAPLAVNGPGFGGLAPTLVAGPTINVAAGACWVDGHYAELNPGTSIPASANGLLVVRFTPADGRCQLVYVDSATVCTQTAATWELPIAQMLGGVLRDIRWPAGIAGGEIAYLAQPSQVVLTASHTVASPIDVINLPAVYFDGAAYEFAVRSGAGFITPATGSTGQSLALWIDGAAVPNGLLTQCYQPGGPHLFGRTRYAPPAGVHQVRARGYMFGASTGGAWNIPGELTIRRV